MKSVRARRRAGALHGRRAGRRGRHHRVRDGDRQGRRALGLPRRGRRVAGRLLPGGRAARAATASPPRSCCSTGAEDVGLRRFFAGGHVEVDELAHVLDAVRRGVPATDLRAELDLSDTKLASALSRLEDAGAVRVAMDGEVAPVSDAPSAELVTAAAEAEEMRRSFDRSRVDMMRAYAETDDCRRAFILSYFGEPFEPPCGFCDNCEAGRVERPAVRCAVPGRRPRRPRLVGRGRRPALRRRLDGRPVRRGGLQDARAWKSCASARC